MGTEGSMYWDLFLFFNHNFNSFDDSICSPLWGCFESIQFCSFVGAKRM